MQNDYKILYEIRAQTVSIKPDIDAKTSHLPMIFETKNYIFSFCPYLLLTQEEINISSISKANKPINTLQTKITCLVFAYGSNT